MTRFSVSRVISEAQEQTRLGELAREIFDQAYEDLRQSAPSGNAYLVLYVDKEDGSSARNGCDSPPPEHPPRTFDLQDLLLSCIAGSAIGVIVAWFFIVTL